MAIALHNRIQCAFFAWGWLLPAVLPLTQVGGRAAYNILAGIYCLWGGIALYRSHARYDRPSMIIYGALLVAFLLGAPGAEDSIRAADKWLSFAFQSTVFPFTLAALQGENFGVKRLQQATAIGGLATLLLLYLLLGFYLCGETFTPRSQLKEDNLAFLLPFILASLGQRRNQSVWLQVVVFLMVFAFIVISQGRAALLGLIVALGAYGLMVQHWRFGRVLAAMIVVLSFSVIASAGVFFRLDTLAAGATPLEAFTSYRTLLWQRALDYPPASPLIGVGMGNSRYVEQIFAVNGVHYGHFHNFLLDAWYETGLLGLGALLAMILYPLYRLAQVWPYLNADARRQAGVFLAAAAAILSAGLLSFSYNSPQFAMYLLLFLAGLLHLANGVCPESQRGSTWRVS